MRRGTSSAVRRVGTASHRSPSLRANYHVLFIAATVISSRPRLLNLTPTVVVEDIFHGLGRFQMNLTQVCTVKNRVSVYAYACGGLRPLGAYTGNANRYSRYIYM